MPVRSIVCGLVLTVLSVASATAQGTRLLRHPTVSHDMVAFEYGGDLWVVPRTGGDARRLTATPSLETDPYFSPDGSQIAYTATVGGNTDVYVIPVAGGEPKRLTYHPGIDAVRGWTPDGRRVIFGSSRGTLPTPGANSYFRLWTVSVDGDMPEPLPMPRAYAGSFSPDGKRMAYQALSVPIFAGFWAENEVSQWRRYRGGRTQAIRVMNLGDYSEEQLPPGAASNNTDPMWIGNTIYFLSDRDNTVNLVAYNLDTKQLTSLTHHRDFDIKNAAATSDAIVYEQAGTIHLVDLKSGQSHDLDIRVNGDFPWAQPQLRKVSNLIADNAAISPTGVRAAFEARGDIFTVPADGQYRNLTHSSGVHDRSPAWSPDGEHIAWLADPGDEYQLMIGDQTGAAAPRAIALPTTAFFSSPVWAPDAKHLLLTDNDANLWTVDITSAHFTKIDTDYYQDPGREFGAVWSPDSRWVAYSKALGSHMRAIFLYSMATDKATQVTDRMADAISPAFDAGGKYLYFLASTNYALSAGWLDMSAEEQRVRRSAYLILLSPTAPSPFLPTPSDEPDSVTAAKTGAAPVDLDGIQQRIVAIPLPPGEYTSLSAGSPGTFLYSEGAAAQHLWQYRVADAKPASLIEGIRSYEVSADKKKLLYHAGNQWGIVPADHPAKVGDGALDVDGLETVVDPKAEWAEIFRDAWRTQREFFYDAKMHGNNWQAIYDKYKVFVPFVEHRADLGYLLASVGGELTVGHSYLEGPGDEPDTAHVPVGVLGADYAVDHGHYRIQKIYTSGNWNPQLKAPLAIPGLKIAEGDYILAVNGQDIAPPANLYRVFEGTANKQTTLRVNSAPSLQGSRLVTVVPIEDDEPLRTAAWIEGNRLLVDKLSGGRLGYVWLPNTAGGGYTSFKRMYFPQIDKDGMVIDERYNQGGAVADYIVDFLNRPIVGYFAQRAGTPITMPMMTAPGPKVMVINESAGSGGDALPYYFRALKLGPLVGTRTWGGLVGTLGVPAVTDEGGITAPNLAFYNPDGKWGIENEGIAPDIEVENAPAAVINGHDPQLERAVAEALKLLNEHPVHRVPRPAPIDRVTAGSQ
jgi:tricorn protease